MKGRPPRDRASIAKALQLRADRRGRPPPPALDHPHVEARQGLGLLRLGKPGVRRWGRRVDEEFDPRLQGKRAARKYDEMAANSPGIGGAYLLIQSLLSQVSLTFEVPVDCEDPDAAEPIRAFYESCLRDLRTPLGQILSEWFSLAKHGFALSEVVYKIRLGDHEHPSFHSRYSDGRIGWYDFEPRAQDSVEEWVWENAGVVGFWQQVEGEGTAQYIPMTKCLHFVIPTEKRSPEGRSMFRAAHRAYFFRTTEEEFEGIGIERNLNGLPVMEVPPHVLLGAAAGGDNAELTAWENMVRRIRFDAQEGIVIPAAKYDGQDTGYVLRAFQTDQDPSKAHDAIMRHRADELLALLAEFLALGTGQAGSWSLADSQTGTLAHALGAIVRFVVDAFNAQEVPRLGRLNGFATHLLPELRAGDLESVDLEKVSGFLAATVGAGVITPDETLEEWTREQGKMPPIDRALPARSSAGANSPASVLARAQALLGGTGPESER